MGGSGRRVALLGATGAVGGEILRGLEEGGLPVAELRAFASRKSEGEQLEFGGGQVAVEVPSAERLADVDLVLCAAPDVLPELLPSLRASGAGVVDVSGSLELDPEAAVYLPGSRAAAGPLLAVPRGAVAALAAALAPIHERAVLERVTALVLESASGAGRRGTEELSAQTIELLSSMSGQDLLPEVFPLPLAFDCLPIVGELLEGGESSEEQRLRLVLRRAIGAPDLAIEVTRVRVPVFAGSLSSVHVQTARPLDPEAARDLWSKCPGLCVLDPPALPTPRSSVASDEALIGRVRPAGGPGAGLAFAVAVDDLRRGAALAVLEAARALAGDA